jgi:hypothetical protein
VTNVEITFYSSRGWESGSPGRVAGGGGADSMQRLVNLIFLKIYASEILFYLSRRIEHKGKNRILNGYHMIEINYFKILLLCKMM